MRYRNFNESTDRRSSRAVRSLVIIHRVDEINVMDELGKAAIAADSYYYRMEFLPRVRPV